MGNKINVFEAANRPRRKLTAADKIAINRVAIMMMVGEIEDLQQRAKRLAMPRTAMRLKQAVNAARYQLQKL